METVKITLEISRAGPAGVQNKGDEVEVSLAEAGRLVRQGACVRPSAKILKQIAAFEARGAVETAAAPDVAEVETASAAEV